MWRKKTDKRIVAAGVIFVGLIIGYQSWKDMQPHPIVRQQVSFTSVAMASESAELTQTMPRAVTKVVAWAGDLKTAEDGTVTYTPSPLAPVITPQLELMPKVTLDALPTNYTPVFEKIAGAIKPWHDAGNIINDVYIDYQDDKPNLEKLGTFINGLRGFLQREFYFVLQVKRGPKWDSEAVRNEMANLLKGTEFFVYKLKDVQKPGEKLAETATRLDEEGLPFMLIIDEEPDNDLLVKAMPEPKQFFAGFVLDIDAKKQEKKP